MMPAAISATTPSVRDALLAIVRRVCVLEEELVIEILPSALVLARAERKHEPAFIELRVRANPASQRTSTIIRPTAAGSGGDPALIKAIARGHVWFDELASSAARTVVEIAKREGVTDRYVSCLIKLAFLSPTFIKRLLAGETLPGVSTKQLILCMDCRCSGGTRRSNSPDVRNPDFEVTGWRREVPWRHPGSSPAHLGSRRDSVSVLT